jgi:hypothetical protein
MWRAWDVSFGVIHHLLCGDPPAHPAQQCSRVRHASSRIRFEV